MIFIEKRNRKENTNPDSPKMKTIRIRKYIRHIDMWDKHPVRGFMRTNVFLFMHFCNDGVPSLDTIFDQVCTTCIGIFNGMKHYANTSMQIQAVGTRQNHLSEAVLKITYDLCSRAKI